MSENRSISLRDDKPDKPERGVCRFCGCTEARACPGGCYWVDAEQTVCSNGTCLDRYFEPLSSVVELWLASHGVSGERKPVRSVSIPLDSRK
jgi:hypothetical protein